MSQTRILVHAPNWIGDMIQSYPFFRSLRLAFPSAHITVFVRPQVASLVYRLQVDEVEVYSSPFEALGKSMWRWMQRHRGADWAFNLTRSEGVAALFWALAPRNVAQVRAGSRGESRQGLYLGLCPGPIKLLFPLPAFCPKQEWGVGERDACTERAGLAIAPGSQAESRRVPLKVYEDLIERYWVHAGKETWLLGGKAEVPLGQRLEKRFGSKVRNCIHSGTVAELAPLLKGVKVLVSNDSGIAHVGALLSCPTVVLWGAGHRDETCPMGDVEVLTPEVSPPCWPCVKNKCFKKENGSIPCLQGFLLEEMGERIFQAVCSRL